MTIGDVTVSITIRATTVSILDECNFVAPHVMRVLGHKFESSIHSCSKPLSEVKQKEISHALCSAFSVVIHSVSQVNHCNCGDASANK